MPHPRLGLTARSALGVQQDPLHRCLPKHVASSLPDHRNGVEGNFPGPTLGVPRAMEEVVHQDAVHGEAGLGGEHTWEKGQPKWVWANHGFGAYPKYFRMRNTLDTTLRGR